MTRGESSGLAGTAVRLVTRVLPAGPVRDRYRQEFLAELHGLRRTARLVFVLGIASRACALRVAVRGTAPAVEVEPARRRKPLLGRTGLHHRWRTVVNPDGEPYQRCARCGEDRSGGMSTKDFAGSVAGNMTMPGW